MTQDRLQMLAKEGEVEAIRELLRQHKRNNDHKALKEFQEYALRMMNLWVQLSGESVILRGKYPEPRAQGDWKSCMAEFGAIQEKPSHKWHLVRPRWGSSLCGRNLLLKKVPDFVNLLYYSSLLGGGHRDKLHTKEGPLEEVLPLDPSQHTRVFIWVNSWSPSIPKEEVCIKCRRSHYGRHRVIQVPENRGVEKVHQMPDDEKVDLWWKLYIPVFYGVTNA